MQARWDADGAFVFRPPPGASDEWRASSDASTNEAFRNALQQDQRATTEYGVSRGNTQAPERDRTENERHLRFVHDWQGQLNESGGAGASDAQASLRYEQTRSGAPNATTDSAEFERHLHYVASQSGGEGDEEIVIAQGGFGAALGMTAGLFDRYDRTQEIIAADNERRRVMAAHEATHAATPAPGVQGAPQTTATPTVPAGTVSPTATTTTPTPTTGTPTPRGGTEAHWEDDEDIRLPDPDRPGADTGWGAALGLMAPILSRYDADYTHDSHWGQHEVPATPATPATTPTAATPTTPAGGAAVPAVQAAVASTEAATATAAVATAATHHDLAGTGTRPRERSIDGTDPTDVIAHLDDQDLEDLATMLFERLQTRLRRDLIVDRERTGFLTDFR